MVQHAIVHKRKIPRRKVPTTSALAIAKKALRGVNKMKRQVEHKSADVANTDSTVSGSAGVVVRLYSISNGDTDTTMDGDKAYLKYMHTRSVFLSLGGMLLDANIRYIIIKCPVSQGTPAVTDILETANTLSHYKRDTDVKFSVLSDNLYKVGVGSTNNPAGAGVPSSRIVNRKYTLNCTYDNDGTNEKNACYAIVIHDGTTEQLYYSVNTRVHFTDL